MLSKLGNVADAPVGRFPGAGKWLGRRGGAVFVPSTQVESALASETSPRQVGSVGRISNLDQRFEPLTSCQLSPMGGPLKNNKRVRERSPFLLPSLEVYEGALSVKFCVTSVRQGTLDAEKPAITGRTI